MFPGGGTDLNNLKKLTAHTSGLDTTSTQSFEGTTSGEGRALIADLPIGVYLVSEDPTGAVDEKGTPVTDVQPSDDFLVFVPTTTPDNKGWDYEVTVYPKNTSDKAVKTVEDSNKNVGDEIKYTLEFAVPAINNQTNEQRTKFVIDDDYDEGKLSNMKVTSLKMGDLDFKQGQDYSVKDSGGHYLITFEKSGLAKLVNGKIVVAELTATITAPGEIVNSATRISNNPKTQEDSTKKTNDVKTYLGKFKITKVGEKGEVLKGAKFDVFRCGINKQKQGETIQTIVTNEKGEAITKGLHVTDIENHNKNITDHRQYCVQETEAPAGYILDKEVHSITLTREDITNRSASVVTFDAIKDGGQITNKPSDTPDLPLTGGQGIALLVILGAGVAGAAVYSARRNSTKA
ncbi:SpaH/EbpB family LPXTG-anchored major pilin [Arcanobacterium canis]